MLPRQQQKNFNFSWSSPVKGLFLAVIFIFSFSQLLVATTSTPAGSPVVITSSYTSSSNAVTVNGNVTSENGSTVTERGIVYGTAAAPTLSNNKIASGAGTGTFSGVTPTLSAGIYFFRAYATNSSGTSYGAELTTTICSPNLPTLLFKLSPPDITTSAIQGQPGIRTENFNTQATGEIPASGTVANGTYTKTGPADRKVAIEPNAVWGGTESQYLSLMTNAVLNITLTDPSRYLGFWWGGGDDYNRVTIFGSCGGNEIQLGQFTTSSVTNLLAGPTVTAVDGNSYPSASYRRANAFNQPFAFINLELSDPNVYFTRMEVTQSGGGYFEIDNITSGTVYGAASYTTPSAMTISSITAGGNLTVNFNAPSSNGGQPITNFEYSTNGGTNWAAASPVVTTSPLVISGLSTGTTYSVRIRAVNSIGYGPQSSAVNATPISVPASSLTIIPTANQTYTGSALTPAIVVKDGATTLTLGTDYTVGYTANTDLGTATVTITGLGIYTGTQTQTFAIVAWTTRTSAADYSWYGVAYGNGVFVAVANNGSGNRVMTSSDGITWTSRTSAADNGWWEITYGNGLFVAVANSGTGNRVMTSPDGITWTIRTSAADYSWRNVAYGNGLYVAVAATGTGNRVMTSPDGITWTARTSAADNNWYNVTYGNGLFVAVSNSGTGNRVMTSSDGITWTSRTSAADNNWGGLAYGNGLFVTVATSGTGNRVMTSPDGITWTSRTSAEDNNWYSLTYGNGLFVAVSDNGTNRVMTSPDGITWTAQKSIVNNAWYGIAYGNGLFVAVAGSGIGNRVMTSNAAVSRLTIEAIADQTYTGTPLTPAIVVKDGNTTMTLGTHYSVAYSNNTNVGTATVTITGMGNFLGTKTETFAILKAASSLTIDPIADQIYTGSALTPVLVVKDGGTTLTLGTDYTIAYSNNTNLGTATATITGMSNYTGTTTQTFTIVAKAASTLTIDAIANQTYTGSALTPAVVVKDGNTTLTATTDYTVAYSNNTNVGTATVTITGAGNYSGTKTQTFTIAAKSASTLTIDAIANQTYTGSALTPALVVKDGNTPLTATTDYTVAYTNNTNVGTATVTITGAGNYLGTKTQTFSIVAKAASTLTIDAIANQNFTGAAITPTVVVKDGSTTLTATTDYTAAYTNNTNVGTATVTITGVGNYTGTKTQTFAITSKPATSLSIDPIAEQIYTGSALTPVLVVKDGATTLTRGTDYSVAYSNNTNVGTATVTITGIGIYVGTKTQTFTIVAKAASTLSIDAIANQTYTGSALTPTVVVKDGSTTLTATTDYTVAYTNNTNLGTATVTITGAGNYTGTKTQTFTIVAKAASTLTIDAIANQTYTGSALTPAVVVKDGSTTLTPTTDYTVAYTNNTNVGTATVTITGVGNYSGTKAQTFAIVAKGASTLTIDAIANQTYTGAAISPTVLVKDGNTTLILGTDYTVAYSDNTDAGTARVTITGIGNYTGTKTQTFTIAPKALTIRANNASKIYGDANPSFRFTYSGLVDGYTEIDQAPSISTSATTTSGVGTYRIILTGGSDPNYTLTRVEGVLEVTPASLLLSMNGATKIYGQADPVYTYSIQGLKGADTEAVLRGALSREAGEEPGTYRIAAGTISAGANYSLSVTGANLQIVKARALSVAELGLVTTEWSKEAVLPATVDVLATHGQYFRVEVKWDKSKLNLLARGTYSLIGTLILPAGIENPDQILAKVQVQVLPKPAPLDLTLNNTSFAGSTTVFFLPVGGFVITDPVDNIHVVSFLGEGYDNKFFYIQNNILYWNSAERAPGKTTFSIVVRVTDRDGNTLDKFFEIRRTRPDFSSVTIYNSFTPNGDRFNDTWGVTEVRFYEGARISVYERGGARVFYTENPDIRWDGTSAGKELPIATYFWVIDIKETGETRRGMLNLIRK